MILDSRTLFPHKSVILTVISDRIVEIQCAKVELDLISFRLFPTTYCQKQIFQSLTRKKHVLKKFKFHLFMLRYFEHLCESGVSIVGT